MKIPTQKSSQVGFGYGDEYPQGKIRLTEEEKEELIEELTSTIPEDKIIVSIFDEETREDTEEVISQTDLKESEGTNETDEELLIDNSRTNQQV